MGASAPGGPHVDDTQAWEDSATAGAVVRRVHGGPITNPIFFLSGLLRSTCSNGTTRPRGKTLRRRAPSPGTFMGDPSRPRLVPLRPSSVHLLERNDLPAWEDAAPAGAVAGHVHGGPITNPTFFLSGLLQSILAFISPLSRTVETQAGDDSASELAPDL